MKTLTIMTLTAFAIFAMPKPTYSPMPTCFPCEVR